MLVWEDQVHSASYYWSCKGLGGRSFRISENIKIQKLENQTLVGLQALATISSLLGVYSNAILRGLSTRFIEKTESDTDNYLDNLGGRVPLTNLPALGNLTPTVSLAPASWRVPSFSWLSLFLMDEGQHSKAWWWRAPASADRYAGLTQLPLLLHNSLNFFELGIRPVEVCQLKLSSQART